MAISTNISLLERDKFVEATSVAGQPAVAVVNADGSDIGGSGAPLDIEGNVAHDAVDSGNPVKIGGRAQDPTSLPAAVAVNDRTDGYYDLSGRIITNLGVQLGSNNDSIAAHVGADANVTGMSTLFDADGDNTAQVLNASPGNLYKVTLFNNDAANAFLQLFNVAAGSVTVGTTTPKYVIALPSSSALADDYDTPMTFSTATTYAFTTTATGSGDPTTGVTASFGNK